MNMKTAFHLAITIVLLFAATAGAQDALATVRGLYASAEYEKALSALNGVTSDAHGSAAVEIGRYRVLCLIALGRASDANKAIESIVISNPFYEPGAAEVSPRVRAAFTAVRQRVLPGFARVLYADAKAAFDRKSYGEALLALDKTLKVIDNIDPAARAELADLRVVASGFLELAQAAFAPPVAPVAPPPAPPARTEPPPAAQPLPATGLVVLKQDLPPMPVSIASQASTNNRGVVEIDINEAGNVTGARVLQSVHVLYDALLLNATRGWKYEPPRVDGKPTASRKRVEIVLRP
jgi:TonB family protein